MEIATYQAKELLAVAAEVRRGPETNMSMDDKTMQNNAHQAKINERLATHPKCKWCRMPGGKHHPDCVSRRGEFPDAERLREAFLEAQDQFKQEYEMNFLAPAQPPPDPMAAESVMEDDPTLVWKIEKGVLVLVSDKLGKLHEHVMKEDAIYGKSQLVPTNTATLMSFFAPHRPLNSYTVRQLFDAGFLVIETGEIKWPFIVISKKAPIIVYETDSPCRKLGYETWNRPGLWNNK